MQAPRRDVDVAVIGAGQAGLSAAFHLRRKGFVEPDGLVVLDRNPRPGGAWQHRWPTLRMADVHGIHRLPGRPAPDLDHAAPARDAVPAYFAAYERQTGIHVHRPVTVRAVRESGDGRLDVDTTAGGWRTRALVNATGTWDLPFVPHYPGIERFGGQSVHTADYRGPAAFTGKRVLVVGGGASAVQLLAELSTVADTTWVTRRPPRWRTGEPFTSELGRAAVARVDERVRAGLPPGSVVSVIGCGCASKNWPRPPGACIAGGRCSSASNRPACAGRTAPSPRWTRSCGAPVSARPIGIWPR